jgi:hypothetical protein
MPGSVPSYPVRAPNWTELLLIGWRELSRPARYGWYFAAVIILSALDSLFRDWGAAGGILSVALSFASLYATLLLARFIMTRQLTTAPHDGSAVLRLVGLFLLIAMVVGVPMIVLTLLVGAQAPAVWIIVAVAVIVGLYLTAQLAFYLPALALGDETSIGIAFRQGASFGGRVLAVFLAIAVVAGGAGLLMGLSSLPNPIAELLSGVVGAAAGIVGGNAICHLYVNLVRERP